MVGRNGLTKDVLLGIFSDAEAEEPASHLATGNVTFQTDGDSAAVRNRVEREIERVIGRLKPVFIRSIEHLRWQIENDPFEDAPFDDVYGRCVSFTSGPAIEIDFPLATPRAMPLRSRPQEMTSSVSPAWSAVALEQWSKSSSDRLHDP
jgi:uncharacterized protein (DUF1697 family)